MTQEDYLPGIPAVLSLDPGIDTGWALLAADAAILGTGVLHVDDLQVGLDTIVRGMHRAGYALQVVVEAMPRAGGMGELSARLEEIRHIITIVIEEEFERPIVYIAPGQWKPSRVARTAHLPETFGGKPLKIHQQDAIKVAMYYITKEGAPR